MSEKKQLRRQKVVKKPKNELPLISIIIPSFNKIKFIGQTLQSIVDQKYPNLEVIIIDGGSSDGSLKVIKNYANKYPKIFKWISKKDKGQLDGLCKGIKRSKGEIVTFINADDLYKKNALKKVASVFQKNPDIYWITGFGEIIDYKNEPVAVWVTRYKNYLTRINNYKLLLMVNYITQPATFIKRDAYNKYGPFSGNSFVMEYDLWLKLGKVQMPTVIPETLASFRLLDDSISATSFKDVLKLDDQIAKKYTKNKLILWFHTLHNLARIKIVSSVIACKIQLMNA